MDRGQIDGTERELGFDALDLFEVGPGLDAFEMFHVEQDVPFVVRGAAGGEDAFVGEEGSSDAAVSAGFFLEFACEGVCGGLGEVDVPAREVGVALVGGVAEEDGAVDHQDASCDRLDGSVVSHGWDGRGGVRVWRR